MMPRARRSQRSLERFIERADIARRKAIEVVPDGTYRSVLDADGFDEDETHIECAVTVDGSTLHIDYDGTSKQIDQGFELGYGHTYGYSTYPVKCAPRSRDAAE